MKVIVSLYARSSTTIKLSAHAEELFRTWQDSNRDDDFENLAEWILEDVAENLDIEIEDVEETS